MGIYDLNSDYNFLNIIELKIFPKASSLPNMKSINEKF